MTHLVERLAQLRRHLDHLHKLRPRVSSASLAEDLSLHNDVLFSLLTVCQLVIDISGELCARRGLPFEDYAGAIRGLTQDPSFPPTLVEELVRLPGFRNIVIHEYVSLDLDRVVEALDRLGPIEQFGEIVRGLEAASD